MSWRGGGGEGTRGRERGRGGQGEGRGDEGDKGRGEGTRGTRGGERGRREGRGEERRREKRGARGEGRDMEFIICLRCALVAYGKTTINIAEGGQQV